MFIFYIYVCGCVCACDCVCQECRYKILALVLLTPHNSNLLLMTLITDVRTFCGVYFASSIQKKKLLSFSIYGQNINAKHLDCCEFFYCLCMLWKIWAKLLILDDYTVTQNEGYGLGLKICFDPPRNVFPSYIVIDFFIHDPKLNQEIALLFIVVFVAFVKFYRKLHPPISIIFTSFLGPFGWTRSLWTNSLSEHLESI